MNKKGVKLLLMAIAIAGTMGTTSYSRSISINGMSDLIKLMSQVASSTYNVDMTTVQQYQLQLEQFQNELRQIEIQVRNAQRLGEDVRNLSASNLDYLFRDMLTIQNNAKGQLNSMENVINKYNEIFYADPEDFTSLTGFTEQDMVNMKAGLIKAKTENNYMIYNGMVKAGMMAKINNDEENIRLLSQAANSAGGTLEALTVSSNILSAMHGTLIEMKSLMAAQTQIVASTNAAANKEELTYQAKWDELTKEIKDKSEKNIEAMRNSDEWKKNTDSNYDFNKKIR